MQIHFTWILCTRLNMIWQPRVVALIHKAISPALILSSAQWNTRWISVHQEQLWVFRWVIKEFCWWRTPPCRQRSWQHSAHSELTSPDTPRECWLHPVELLKFKNDCVLGAFVWKSMWMWWEGTGSGLVICAAEKDVMKQTCLSSPVDILGRW